MKKRYYLSVIVPVYNAAPYVEKCIESILFQTFSDFELILVDDGSTDNSGEICDKYAQEDSRVRVLHIENSGTFQARKLGVQRANSELVTFADADDWLEVNAFELAMEYFNCYDIDLFTYTYDVDGMIVKHLYEEGVYSSEEIRNKIVKNMMYDMELGKRRLDPSLCCKYIKKDLFLYIANIVSERVTLGEDALVTYPSVCISKQIYICNASLYHYRNNSTSCTHTYPIDRIAELMNFQNNIKKVFTKVNLLKEMEFQVEQYMRQFLNVLLKNWYGIELSYISYRFPYDKVLPNKKIIIYGAGVVGKSYVRDIKRCDSLELVAWIDKNYMNINSYNNIDIVSLNQIVDKEFDLLVIAVKNYDIANEIFMELKDVGIREEKIFWIEPYSII